MDRYFALKYQHEANLVTLIMQHKLTQSLTDFHGDEAKKIGSLIMKLSQPNINLHSPVFYLVRNYLSNSRTSEYMDRTLKLPNT